MSSPLETAFRVCLVNKQQCLASSAGEDNHEKAIHAFLQDPCHVFYMIGGKHVKKPMCVHPLSKEVLGLNVCHATPPSGELSIADLLIGWGGLICRVYSHFLVVVDDDDFHELQSTFSLGQQRAIATTLNTLIFRTRCPAEAAPRAGKSKSPNLMRWLVWS